jgi:hypothetical protein
MPTQSVGHSLGRSGTSPGALHRRRGAGADDAADPVERDRLGGELGLPPGGACGCVRRRVGPDGESGDDVVGRGLVARVVAEWCELGDELGELGGVLEVDRDGALVAGGAAERPRVGFAKLVRGSSERRAR